MRITEKADTQQLRDNFADDLEMLGAEFREIKEHPGDVAPGPRQRFGESSRDGVALQIDRNNWDCPGCLQRRGNRGWTAGVDHVGSRSEQFSRGVGKAIRCTVRVFLN